MTTVVHDVLIIGAGPAGLAIAARLPEPTPSAVFTDAEHNRYQCEEAFRTDESSSSRQRGKVQMLLYIPPQHKRVWIVRCSFARWISFFFFRHAIVTSNNQGFSIKVVDRGQ